MLSYRHAFHAGNHADVLKHLCLMLALERMTAKPKPMVYIDTHAGAGMYDPADPMVGSHQEAGSGLGRLLAGGSTQPLIQRYVAAHSEHRILGSPALARAELRETDQMILMELHGSEVEALRRQLSGPAVAIHHRDGFEGLPGLVPPLPARGLVLIDPPYEDKQDYRRVVECCERAVRRWAHGVYLIWYPVLSLQRDRSTELLAQLAALPVQGLLVAELRVQAQAEDFGMCGSGMVVLNPPWQLDEQLQTLLPELHQLLAEDGQGGWSLRDAAALLG